VRPAAARQRLRRGPLGRDPRPHDLERAQEALLTHGVARAWSRAPRRRSADRPPRRSARRPRLPQLGKRLVEPVGAELVSAPCEALPSTPYFQPLSVRYTIAVGWPVSSQPAAAVAPPRLLDVAPVGDEDHVPVVQVEQLPGVPLHVVARGFALAAHAVAVDRGLIPSRCRTTFESDAVPAAASRLGDATRREPPSPRRCAHAGVGAPVVTSPRARRSSWRRRRRRRRSRA